MALAHSFFYCFFDGFLVILKDKKYSEPFKMITI